MFTIVDGVVAIILVGSAGFAFLRGFVHEVLAIAGWVGAGFIAYAGFPYAQSWFRAQIGMPLLADIVAVALLFLAALLVFSLITKAVANRIRRSALNSVDSSLGFVFGLIRGAIVVSLGYMLVTWMIAPEPQPAWLANAKTRPWLERGAHLIESLRPDTFGQLEQKTAAPGSAPQAQTPAATGNLIEDSHRAVERDKIYQDLAAPQPAADPSKTTHPAGYDKDQRREMDRLFQSNQ